MAVNFKFRSSKAVEKVPVEGAYISLSDLKYEIVKKKKLDRATDFDLVIENAQTRERATENTFETAEEARLAAAIDSSLDSTSQGASAPGRWAGDAARVEHLAEREKARQELLLRARGPVGIPKSFLRQVTLNTDKKTQPLALGGGRYAIRLPGDESEEKAKKNFPAQPQGAMGGPMHGGDGMRDGPPGHFPQQHLGGFDGHGQGFGGNARGRGDGRRRGNRPGRRRGDHSQDGGFPGGPPPEFFHGGHPPMGAFGMPPMGGFHPGFPPGGFPGGYGAPFHGPPGMHGMPPGGPPQHVQDRDANTSAAVDLTGRGAPSSPKRARTG